MLGILTHSILPTFPSLNAFLFSLLLLSLYMLIWNTHAKLPSPSYPPFFLASSFLSSSSSSPHLSLSLCVRVRAHVHACACVWRKGDNGVMQSPPLIKMHGLEVLNLSVHRPIFSHLHGTKFIFQIFCLFFLLCSQK